MHFFRHFIMIVLIALNHFNQLLFRSGYSVSTISSATLIKEIIFYLIIICSIYANIYLLIPRLLMKQNYLKYVISIIILLMIPVFYFHTELILYDNNANNLAMLLKSLSFYGYVFMWVIGVSVFVFLKKTIQQQNESDLLRQNFLRTSITRYRELINPNLLSTVLRNTANGINEDPGKSSATLIILSKILRYRLYDSATKRVFLDAEAVYIEQYLSLINSYNKNFNFNLNEDGFRGVTISPLILSALLQKVTDDVNSGTVSLKLLNKHIEFKIYWETNIKINIGEIINRLNLFYPDSYEILLNDNSITLTLKC